MLFRALFTTSIITALLVLLACSDDAGDSKTPDANNDPADVIEDIDTHDEIDTTPQSDVEDGEDGEDEDSTPRYALGEACPLDCRPLGDGASVARCEGCQGGYCLFPNDHGTDQYCTQQCVSPAQCEQIAAGWECGADFPGMCNAPK